MESLQVQASPDCDQLVRIGHMVVSHVERIANMIDQVLCKIDEVIASGNLLCRVGAFVVLCCIVQSFEDETEVVLGGLVDRHGHGGSRQSDDEL
jgi:hypothetical protein